MMPGSNGALGPLADLFHDPTVTEIMVNGPQEIFIERQGHLTRVEREFRSAHELLAVIEYLLSTTGRTVNEATPLCDATIADGSRMNVILPPLSLNGPVVTIRRKLRDWTMEEYVGVEALDQQLAEFLQGCVTAKINFIISGGTSTGKTTLVAILSNSIPRGERIVTIENVAELHLPGPRHWIRLIARLPNLEGKGEVPLRTLVKNALSMRPDRIILGEARGGEALDVVQAMQLGHEGVMTVLHANSPLAALERLETLMLMSGLDLPPSACRTQLTQVVDLIVHMNRFVDGSRRIALVTQIRHALPHGGYELDDLFRFEAQGFSPDGKLSGTTRYTGAVPKFLSKFHLNNVPLPSWIATA